MATLREPATGVEFPRKQQFWHGGLLTCLGAGLRTKKVGFIGVKVYAISMYVDADAAVAAGRTVRQPSSEAATLDVLRNGAFTKVLQMHLVRGVTGKQFTDALDKRLRPLMKGDEAVLDQFCAFFAGKQLDKGSEVSLLRRTEGALDVCLCPPGERTPYSNVQPDLTIASALLGHALWDLYLSPQAPAPEARKAWLAALPALVAQTAEA